MRTGLIESWTGNPLEIGPMYPLVGLEMLLFVISFALAIIYTIWQLRLEARTYEKETRALGTDAELRSTIIAGAPHCYDHAEPLLPVGDTGKDRND